MGEFNDKVSRDKIGETCTGAYGIAQKNRRAKMPVKFAELHKFKIMNTLLKKPPNRKWTWISPKGAIKTEIHYIITDKLDIFLNVSVINSLNTGSDHRLMKEKERIDTWFVRENGPAG